MCKVNVKLYVPRVEAKAGWWPGCLSEEALVWETTLCEPSQALIPLSLRPRLRGVWVPHPAESQGLTFPGCSVDAGDPTAGWVLPPPFF